jgi:hypothetical protein
MIRRLEHALPNFDWADFSARIWSAARRHAEYSFVESAELIPKLLQGVTERLMRRQLLKPTRTHLLNVGVFCSEAVVLVLREVGVLPRDIPSASLAPWSFTRSGFDQALLPGWSYSPLVLPDVFACVLTSPTSSSARSEALASCGT